MHSLLALQENRSPNPLKLTSSRAAAGAGTPKSRPKSATRSTEGVGLSCPPSREEEAVTKGAEDHAAAELKISTCRFLSVGMTGCEPRPDMPLHGGCSVPSAW